MKNLKKEPIIYYPFYTPGYEAFVYHTVKTANENNIGIRFSNDKLVYSGGDQIGSAGYFSSYQREIAVAIANITPNNIMSLLVHESCHMDQFVSDISFCNKYITGAGYYFNWLAGEIELTDKEVAKYTQDVIALELDCEKRSVEKIKKYKLPLNAKLYVSGANSYLYGILFCAYKRYWYTPIYSYPEVWQNAPKSFSSRYVNIPHNLLAAFDKVAHFDTPYKRTVDY